MGVVFHIPCCREGTCVCQGVGNVAFRGDFAYVLYGWSLSRLNYGISLELVLLLLDYIFVI